MEIYKRTIKALKEKLKLKDITKEEWEEYAHENYLLSSLVLQAKLNAIDFEILKKKVKNVYIGEKITLSEKADNRLVNKIEKVRKELDTSIEKYGIDSEETKKISEKIDKMINKFYANKKEQEYPEDSEIYKEYKKSYKFLKNYMTDFAEFPSVETWNSCAKKYGLLTSESMKYISGYTWHQLRDKIRIEIK